MLIAIYMWMTFRFATNMSIIKRQLQFCLNKLQQWSTDNGFRLSKTHLNNKTVTIIKHVSQHKTESTVCMYICQKTRLPLDPLELLLDKIQFSCWKISKLFVLSFVSRLKYVKKNGLIVW